jgi:hypothetical protein
MYFLMNKALKQKKEVGMKKLVILALAVFLAMPVLTHAGAVNNKWDLTINGYVGVFAQFGDVENNYITPGFAAPRRTGNLELQANELSNFGMQVDPRIGFLIKGPDTWGAKTSAYIEWDFSGINPGAENGDARIRYAWMKFDWGKHNVVFGDQVRVYRQTGTGLPPGMSTLNAEPGPFGGPREVALLWNALWTKNFDTKFALVWPGVEAFGGANATNNFTRSNWPFASGMVRFHSDVCGKIGFSELVAGMSGAYGRQSILRGNGNRPGNTPYSQKQEDGWLGEAFFQIPIIPERKDNKAGALLFYTNVTAGQGLPYGGQTLFLHSANAFPDTDHYSAPKFYGWQAVFNVWFSNTVWLNMGYNETRQQVSNRWRSGGDTATAAAQLARFDVPVRNQFWNLSLFYAPNPALTTGIEYTRTVTEYAGPGYVADNMMAYKKKGTANQVRLGAYYYF